MTKETKQLGDLQEIAKTYGILELVQPVLAHPQFPLWTASPAPHVHHYGKGGLLQHTWEVTRLSRAMAETVDHPIDLPTLLTAAIYHDIGKIYDYRPVKEDYSEWESAPEKYLIYHICQSYRLFNEWTQNCLLDEEKHKAIEHCILAHHGRFEWKSPVQPYSREAVILHQADATSARCDDVLKNLPWEKDKKN